MPNQPLMPPHLDRLAEGLKDAFEAAGFERPLALVAINENHVDIVFSTDDERDLAITKSAGWPLLQGVKVEPVDGDDWLGPALRATPAEQGEQS